MKAKQQHHCWSSEFHFSIWRELCDWHLFPSYSGAKCLLCTFVLRVCDGFVAVFDHEHVWRVHTIAGASVCLGCLSTYYQARNKWRQGLIAGWSAATAAPLAFLPVWEAGRGSEVVPWQGLRNWVGQWGKRRNKKRNHEPDVNKVNNNVKDWVGCWRMTFLWPELLFWIFFHGFVEPTVFIFQMHEVPCVCFYC